MKRVPLVFLVCLLAGVLVAAHEPGRDMASVELGQGKVTIDYGTPKLAGRNLDDLIKPGAPWRMGMNNATTLDTTVALDFGGKKLAAGKYTLFARADENKNWTLLFSSGATTRLDPSTVVLEVPLQFQKEDVSVDVLKITLEIAGRGALLKVTWGTYRLEGVFGAAA